ncbi:MAG: hypothetical protein ACLT47_10915, partial [Sutterella wadsworthensis]
MLRLFPALALVLSLGLAGSGTVSAAPLITVETAPGDDAAIIDGVKRTHAPDPRTKLFEVTAETSGGITVLKGRTDSAEALSDLRAAYYVQKRPVDVRVKLLPDSDDLKKKVWAFTTAPVTRITDLSGRPVTTVPAGTPAARLDEKDGMTLLRLPDGSIGLARSTDVRPCTETEILIRNRHERLIVTADKAVFKPLQEESAPSADVVLPRGAVLRLDGAGDGVMRAALPDGRRGTIAVSAVEKLADFERREESERRSDPAAFMKALSETAVREAASGRHADGGSFLRASSSPATSSCARSRHAARRLSEGRRRQIARQVQARRRARLQACQRRQGRRHLPWRQPLRLGARHGRRPPKGRRQGARSASQVARRRRAHRSGLPQRSLPHLHPLEPLLAGPRQGPRTLQQARRHRNDP